MDNKPEKIISGGASYLLISFAVAADGLQALLGFMGVGIAANTLVTFFVSGAFFIALLLINRRILTNGWNLLYFLAAIFGEAIPLVNMAPGWFLAIRKIISHSNEALAEKSEDPGQKEAFS